jgi:hypothetical protein
VEELYDGIPVAELPITDVDDLPYQARRTGSSAVYGLRLPGERIGQQPWADAS